MIIIGCDPDSNKSGIAEYLPVKFGKSIVALSPHSLFDIFTWFSYIYANKLDAELHIEDLNAISSNAFAVRSKDPLAVKLKKAGNVGQCKQVQIEIERIAEHFNIKIVRHSVSKQWKDKHGKVEFESVTGWTGRSNEDTRSAAYFGMLGVLDHGKK